MNALFLITLCFLLTPTLDLQAESKISLEERIKVLQLSNSPVNKAKYCPDDFTEIEMDGLIPTGPKDEENKRITLARLCGKLTDHSQLKALSVVKLKKKPCSCIHGQMGDFDPVKIKHDHEFPSKDKKGRFECQLMRFHVSCDIKISCGEGCASGSIQCPLSCVDYK